MNNYDNINACMDLTDDDGYMPQPNINKYCDTFQLNDTINNCHNMFRPNDINNDHYNTFQLNNSNNDCQNMSRLNDVNNKHDDIFKLNECINEKLMMLNKLKYKNYVKKIKNKFKKYKIQNKIYVKKLKIKLNNYKINDMILFNNYMTHKNVKINELCQIKYNLDKDMDDYNLKKNNYYNNLSTDKTDKINENNYLLTPR
jgi:hypothetical protein